jgi:hypothetical protein
MRHSDSRAAQVKATADLIAAKEATVRLDGELAVLKARRWWKQIVPARQGSAIKESAASLTARR